MVAVSVNVVIGIRPAEYNIIIITINAIGVVFSTSGCCFDLSTADSDCTFCINTIQTTCSFYLTIIDGEFTTSCLSCRANTTFWTYGFEFAAIDCDITIIRIDAAVFGTFSFDVTAIDNEIFWRSVVYRSEMDAVISTCSLNSTTIDSEATIINPDAIAVVVGV